MSRNEKGIALVLSLFLMAAMSVIAASLMFLSQTETYSSMNYRLMSQARYGAESGIQKTANFLVYSYTLPPGAANADPLASFDTTGSPVKFGGAKVYLSSASNCVGLAHNYPIQAVQDAFCAAAYGTLPSGTTTVSYATTATLLSMQQVLVYGGGLQTIQTWQIVSDGTITAGKTATVEVTATIEMQKLPAAMYAAFATDAGCGALTFSGSSVTKSYDSAAYNGSGSITASNGGLTSAGGNVGTNGNLGESGTATIDGTLSSPRVGVGDCSNGNVDALSSSGNAKLCPDPNVACSGIQTGAVVQLPQAVTMPTPTAPNPVPPTTDIIINSATSCANLGLTSPVCTGAIGNLTLIPSGTLVLGNVSLTGNANVTLQGGAYNFNSINVSANSNLIITPNTGNVVMNIAGTGQTTPVDFNGNSLSNPSYKPAEFQIEYGGTGNVVLNGSSQAAAMIYAPNAIGTLNGNDDFFGSIVTKKLTVSGNANIYYDRSLTGSFFTTGAGMMSAFSWKKY